MKAKEVEIGGIYAARISGKIVPVRLESELDGGWHATNMRTGKTVRIKSARKLRCPWPTEGATEEKAVSTGAKAVKRSTRANTGATGAKLSGLDAAARVLEEAGEALNCKQIVEGAFEKGYWASGGKTPHATIYSAILREIQNKGEDSRFRKAERGKFELAK